MCVCLPSIRLFVVSTRSRPVHVFVTAARYGAVALRQLAPSAVNHVVEVFVQVGRDLTDLGLGPYKCPTSLTSGIHSIIVVRGYNGVCVCVCVCVCPPHRFASIVCIKQTLMSPSECLPSISDPSVLVFSSPCYKRSSRPASKFSLRRPPPLHRGAAHVRGPRGRVRVQLQRAAGGPRWGLCTLNSVVTHIA